MFTDLLLKIDAAPQIPALPFSRLREPEIKEAEPSVAELLLASVGRLPSI